MLFPKYWNYKAFLFPWEDGSVGKALVPQPGKLSFSSRRHSYNLSPFVERGVTDRRIQGRSYAIYPDIYNCEHQERSWLKQHSKRNATLMLTSDLHIHAIAGSNAFKHIHEYIPHIPHTHSHMHNKLWRILESSIAYSSVYLEVKTLTINCYICRALELW